MKKLVYSVRQSRLRAALGLLLVLMLNACGATTIPDTNTPSIASPTSPITAQLTPTATTLSATPINSVATVATTPAPYVIPTLATPADPQGYFTAVFDFIQQNSVRRDKVDWATLRQKGLEMIKDAKTTADTYSAITMVVQALGDKHSSFLEPSQVQQRGGQNQTYSGIPPLGLKLQNNIGYVQIPPFVGLTLAGQEFQQFAVAVQEAIRKADETPNCGWVVDLRFNSGGALWPMLAGVGPILGEGEVGAFVSASGTQKWGYQNGQALVDKQALVAVPQPYQLKKANPAVAVLTSEKTASAAETVLIAFRGRPYTRSFGQATYGVPTGNVTFRLSDGAILNLTTVVEADRTGKIYDGKIEPDQLVERDATLNGTDRDLVTVAAHQWLLDQPACK